MKKLILLFLTSLFAVSSSFAAWHADVTALIDYLLSGAWSN